MIRSILGTHLDQLIILCIYTTFLRLIIIELLSTEIEMFQSITVDYNIVLIGHKYLHNIVLIYYGVYYFGRF